MLLFFFIVALLQVCLGSKEHTLVDVTWNVDTNSESRTLCQIIVAPFFGLSKELDEAFYQYGQVTVALIDDETLEAEGISFEMFCHNNDSPSHHGLTVFSRDCVVDQNHRSCKCFLSEVEDPNEPIELDVLESYE